MSNDFARWGRMAAGAAALALLLGWTTSARADYAYAYSEQTLTGLRIIGADAAGRTISTTATTASTTINGSGISNSNPVDTPQAYQTVPGGPAAPAQNQYTTKFVTTFSPTGTPLPAGAAPVTVTSAGGVTSPVPNTFARGDAVFGVPTPTAPSTTDLFGAGISVANVAEAYTTNGFATGNGGWLLTAGFNTGTSTAVSVAYSFANDLYASVLGAAAAQSGFTFTYSVKNAAGVTVYEYATDSANSALTNGTIGAPPNAPELISSGSQSPGGGILITGLLANNTYSITFTGGESVSVQAAIPAPTSIVMLGLGLGGLGLVRLRNRRVTA